MSDLEATRARASAATPVSQQATHRLKAFSASVVGPAHDEGMLDAFAEVFAQMAAANPAPLEPTPIESDRRINESEHGNDERPRAERDAGENEKDSSLPSELADDRSLTFGLHDQSKIKFTESPRDGLGSEGDAAAESTSQLIVGSDPALADVAPQTLELAGASGTDVKRNRLDARSSSTTQNVAVAADDAPVTPDLPSSDAVQNVPSASQTGLTDDDAATHFAGGDAADATRDRSRRRTDRRVSEPRVTSEDGAQSKPAAEAFTANAEEALRSLPREPLGPQFAEKVGEVAPEVRKAAAAAITGAAPVGSTPGKSASSHNLAASRSWLGDPAAASQSASQTKSNATAKSNAAGDGKASDTVNRIKLIQRVAKAFQHLGPGGGVVRLRLAPAELGTVRIEMRIDNRKVNARVVAETEAASNQLRENLPDLRGRLESYGMQVERIEIETESSERQTGSRFGSHDDGQQHHGNPHQRRSQRPGPDSSTESVSRPVSPLGPPPSTGPLNITSPGSVDLHL